VADRHTAVERVDQAAVPERRVWIGTRGLAERSEHRERVDESVDRAPLAAHHVVDRAAVEERGLGEVRGPLAAGRERFELAISGPVQVVDPRFGGAVAAPARSAAIRVQDPKADPVLVVDERLPETGLDRLAHEG
jgi:hypothetical protein